MPSVLSFQKPASPHPARGPATAAHPLLVPAPTTPGSDRARRLREALTALGLDRPWADVDIATIPFSPRDVSAGTESELQTAVIGDARALDQPDASADIVLMFGPLYHLTERADRLTALREAYRVLRPGGMVYAVGISRFASLFDGLLFGQLGDPAFAAIIAQDLRDGQHRNPTIADAPEWFATTSLHLPRELADEVEEAGFTLDALLGIESPGKYIGAGWADAPNRAHLIAAARAVETEPSLLGVSAHVMAVGKRAGQLIPT
ncbi:MAG: methyltransferase domain-containing protein [Thermomicrobiales bacterium]|nr:methyltransferase domain-containing protein [Thermomicrobiales bacterium]